MNKTVNLEAIRKRAEEYYRSGDFYCSEAIVKTIKDAFDLDISDDVIAMASGFPVGIGRSGCGCGAVSGAVMALGMFFGRTKPRDPKVEKTLELSKELHDKFKDKHASICCRVLTRDFALDSPERRTHCVAITGETAVEVAKIIQRELKPNPQLEF